MKIKFLDMLRLIWKVPLLERVLVKLTLDQPFGSTITKLAPNYYQYSKPTIREVMRHGISFRLDLSDIVDWFIYFGFRENSRQNLYALMDNGKVIMDIGANVGDVSLHASKIVGPSGRIHSFEPDPRNFERFSTNLDLNNFTNIEANPFGLGHEAGTFMMTNVNPYNQGMNRIVNEGHDTIGTDAVRVSTLDTYVREKNIQNIDLIKIDVEGYEYNVLQGSTNAIQSFHPNLFIELDDNQLMEQGSCAQELVTLLEDMSYRLVHAETGEKICSSTIFDNCHYDIIGEYLN